MGNLGPVASAKGHIDIHIRDLDQTVIGNPAHDLIRLGLSLATAARGSDLPGVTTAKMLENMMAGYEQDLRRGVASHGCPTGQAGVYPGLGQAHARQLDMPAKQKWSDELKRHRSARLDAPSWLWSSIVELLVSHEGEYLEHCRRYAMEPVVF